MPNLTITLTTIAPSDLNTESCAELICAVLKGFRVHPTSLTFTKVEAERTITRRAPRGKAEPK